MKALTGRLFNHVLVATDGSAISKHWAQGSLSTMPSTRSSRSTSRARCWIRT